MLFSNLLNGRAVPMRILVEMGCYSLDLTVADDVDLDDRFRATCNDTGETLMVNGWLIESHEVVETAA